MRNLCAALFCIASATAAVAQPAPPAPRDSVTVTADKAPRELLEAFIEAQGVPTRTLDKMARWKVPVCPMAVGVPKNFARFVEKRIKELAAEVGAPVRERCTQNVSIIFTPKPQAIVNEIRRKNSAFIGYHTSDAQGDELAKVSHPIQAWHMTGTRDLRGNLEGDNGRRMSTQPLHIRYPDPLRPEVMLEIYLPSARAATVTGGHLSDGLTSEFTHVLIVADAKWAAEPEIGTIADAMAVLALSRATLSDSCRSMASILDMLAKDCPRAAETKGVTAGDVAFLQALYRVMPDAILAKQKDEMVFKMQQVLTGQ